MDWTHPTLAGAARLAGRCLLVAAFVAAIVYAVTRVPLLLLSLFAALLLTALIQPAVDWLVRSRVPRTLAALGMVLLLVAAVGGVFAWVLPKAFSQLAAHSGTLAQRAQSLAGSIGQLLPGQQAPFRQIGERAGEWIRNNSSELASGIASGAMTLASVLSGVLLAVVFTFFFLRDGGRLVRATFAPLTQEGRLLASRAGQATWRTLSGWVHGTALVALIDAVGIGVGLLILGVPLALPLALLMFVSAFVPVIGAIVAGAVAVLVAWATGGTQDALITLAIVVGVQQLEGNVLQPVIMGRILPLHAVVVLAAVTAGALLAGVAGAFMAVPLLAAIVAGIRAYLNEARRLRSRVESPATASPPEEHAPAAH